MLCPVHMSMCLVGVTASRGPAQVQTQYGVHDRQTSGHQRGVQLRGTPVGKLPAVLLLLLP